MLMEDNGGQRRRIIMSVRTDQGIYTGGKDDMYTYGIGNLAITSLSGGLLVVCGWPRSGLQTTLPATASIHRPRRRHSPPQSDSAAPESEVEKREKAEKWLQLSSCRVWPHVAQGSWNRLLRPGSHFLSLSGKDGVKASQSWGKF